MNSSTEFKVQVISLENFERIAPFSSFSRATIEKSNASLILDPLTVSSFFSFWKILECLFPIFCSFKMTCFVVVLHSSIVLGLNGPCAI